MSGVERAKPEDWGEVSQLLARCGLPLEGLRDHFANAVVVKEAGRIIACAAVELYGTACIVRSMAVAPEARGRGLGNLLTDEILKLARASGCTDACLLTTTAAGLFARHGFSPITRDQVPAAVKASKEFTLNACATATVMHRLI